jgi:Ca-activated chloride channel family protein
MTFHEPSVWLLLLIGLIPLLWWRLASDRRRSSIGFSSVRPLHRSPKTWTLRLRWIVPALRTLAIALLIVCIAGPRKADEQTRIRTEGIAIQLVVDRSGSMRALDFEVEGRQASRLDAVKKVVEDFIVGSDDLPGRPNDLIGLITFATFADPISPMTLDHEHLVEAIRQTRVASDPESGATALGDAIALAAERLDQLTEHIDPSQRHRITSKVMIVLTDGENNAGEFDPELAAELAASLGIRVYTIGAGSNRDKVEIPIVHPVTGETIIVPRHVPLDEATLRTIASIADGAYFRATDTDSLTDVYARIDELEKTEIEQRRYTRYAEAAVQSVKVAGIRLPPLLAVVVVLLLLETLLASTRFRTLP